MAIIQQMSIDAQILSEAMAKMEINEIISYDHINSLIGRDIKQHWGILETARKDQLRNNKLFCTVRNEGLKRVDDQTKVNVASSGLKRIRNIASKTVRILGAVDDFDALPNEQKIRHNAVMSMCGAIRQCTAGSSISKVEHTLKNNNHIMPVAETLALFSS